MIQFIDLTVYETLNIFSSTILTLTQRFILKNQKNMLQFSYLKVGNCQFNFIRLVGYAIEKVT